MIESPTVAQWMGKAYSHAEEMIRADSSVRVLDPLTWVGKKLPHLTGGSSHLSLLTTNPCLDG